MSRGRDGRGLPLADGARIAVIGGGPAGSLCAYFLLRFAGEAGLDLHVDIYEPRDFTCTGPRGCNMCGGLVAGRLLEDLQADGIALPPAVVHNDIDSYELSTSAGSVRIVAPDGRRAAASLYRGAGPRDTDFPGAQGFDAFLLDVALCHGAKLVRQRVTTVTWHDGHPEIPVDGSSRRYDLIVAATGVNLASGHVLGDLGLGTTPPDTARVYITELRTADPLLGSRTATAMGVVLPDVAGVDAVGVVPKGEFSTLCIVGADVDRQAVNATLDHPLMRSYSASETRLVEGACHCSPMVNVGAAVRPFGDRVVLVGDCGVTRLYKDGLGSAFRTARAAAWAAVRSGVSGDDFRRAYWPVYRGIARDNRYGTLVFALLRRLRSSPRLLRASLTGIVAEQRSPGSRRRMNRVLWDLFTGSASYRSILLRVCDPRSAFHVGVQLLRLCVSDPGPGPSLTPDIEATRPAREHGPVRPRRRPQSGGSPAKVEGASRCQTWDDSTRHEDAVVDRRSGEPPRAGRDPLIASQAGE